MGIRGRAVTDNLRNGYGAAAKRVLEILDYQDAGSFAHDKAVAVAIVGTRGAMRRLVKTG